MREVKRRWKALGIGAIALLSLSFLSSEASAQGEAATPEQLMKIEAGCKQQPDLEGCVTLRKECMGNYERMPGEFKRLCRTLGWTRDQAAGRTVSTLKERCDQNDSDEKCNVLRKSCREETLTCEVAQQVACGNPGSESCDPAYLCTPRRLKSMCSGKSDPGALHRLIHLNYSSIRDTPVGADQYQDTLYSISAMVHGQTGDGSINTNYVVDMGLGWLRGEDNNGLAYDLQALIGGGLRKDEKFMVGAAIGGGFGGIISGDLGFAWLVSTELFAAAELISGLDLVGFVRPTLVYSEGAREDGSATLGFADELKLGGSLTWTDKQDEGRFVHGTGYGVSFFMQEQLGVRMFGIGIGVASTDASRTK